MSLALRINDFLSGLFLGVGLKLVDFKLEFGRLYENEEMRIILADEISPDNCRLWDVKTNEKLDKDRFRQDLGKVAEAYQEVARRLGILPEAGLARHARPGHGPVRAKVHITLKPGVPRPAGPRVFSTPSPPSAFPASTASRQGKYIELDLGETDQAAGPRPRRRNVQEAAGQHRDRELFGGNRIRRLDQRSACFDELSMRVFFVP